MQLLTAAACWSLCRLCCVGCSNAPLCSTHTARSHTQLRTKQETKQQAGRQDCDYSQLTHRAGLNHSSMRAAPITGSQAGFPAQLYICSLIDFSLPHQCRQRLAGLDLPPVFKTTQDCSDQYCRPHFLLIALCRCRSQLVCAAVFDPRLLIYFSRPIRQSDPPARFAAHHLCIRVVKWLQQCPAFATRCTHCVVARCFVLQLCAAQSPCANTTHSTAPEG